MSFCTPQLSYLCYLYDFVPCKTLKSSLILGLEILYTHVKLQKLKIHNQLSSCMHTKLTLWPISEADPRSVKCSVKGPITTVPFLPLFLHPAVPILSGVHGQAEHHLRGRAGCHWTLLRGKSMEPTIKPLSFSTSRPALHTESSSARVLRGGYISHGKL